MGRPTKCTPELTEKVYRVLRAGNYIETACAIVGIDQSSLHAWNNRAEAELERRASGEEPDPAEDVFIEFLKATTRARAEAEAEAVAQIKLAAREDWRANAWYLERSHRSRWGKVHVDVTHKGGVELRLNVPTPAGMESDEDA